MLPSIIAVKVSRCATSTKLIKCSLVNNFLPGLLEEIRSLQIGRNLSPMPGITQVLGSRRRTKAIPSSEVSPILSLIRAPGKEINDIACCDGSNLTHAAMYSPNSRALLMCQAGESSGRTASKKGNIEASEGLPKPLWYI